MIPVSIVTGFLGSGKTTLVARVLRDPAFARTAVIVNEFGEIGLDHDLIASSSETLTALTTGCVCCAVRGDLARTLLDLRASGAEYDRVLVETSGLADPAPILHTLMTDGAVAAEHALDAVTTVVDAALGEASILAHPEARRQIAVADRIAVSKLDLGPATAGLDAALGALNPRAARGRTDTLDPSALFGAAAWPDRLDGLPDAPTASAFPTARHTDGIASIALEREAPLPAAALALFLQALAEHCGPKLLRMKGLVAIAEAPDRPAVVHGVQHVFSPPDFLPAWPTADRRTRMVFIGRGIPRFFPARLLDSIAAETNEEIAARARR